uniref:ATP synthase F0 subunit 8 n=1 Tax=Erpobdella testacea TaxID=92797 RepID=A0A7D7A5S1_9ANNE|nr:ATP synthase F0 subunit 8 [Erpobdella testacea]
MPHLSPMSWLLMFMYLLISMSIILSFFWWFNMKNYTPFMLSKIKEPKKWNW